MKAILYALKSPEGWISALFLAAVLVVPAGLNEWLHQTPRSTEKARAIAIEKSIKAQAVRARFERAAQSICGENAAWEEVERGQIKCFTHRGYQTKTVQVSL